MLNSSELDQRRYLCVPLSILLATVLRGLLDPLLGDQFPLATSFLAIVFTAWYAGLLPALLTAVFGYVVADFCFMAPRGSVGAISPDQQLFLFRYALISLTTALLGGVMHHFRVNAQRSAAAVRQQALLIDQLYDAVLVWNWQGTISFWNRGAEQLYGFSRMEAVGKLSHQLLQTSCSASAASAEMTAMEAVLQQLQQHGKWQGELRHVTRTGQQVWVESRMVLVHDDEREYVIETNRDITTRRALEQLRSDMQVQLELQVQQRTAQLARSEHRHHSLIQATAEVVWRMDTAGTPLDDAWLRYSGSTPAQVAQGEHLQAFAPQDRQRIADGWLQALASGHTFQCECMIYRARDHQWRDVLMSLVPVANEAGSIVEWMGICVDVSHRVQAERALHASEAQLRVLLEDIQGHAIITLDRHGMISSWSRGAERIGCYRAEDIAGRAYHTLFTPTDRDADQAAQDLLQATLLGRIDLNGWRVRGNGARYWVNGTLSVLRDGSGALTGYIILMRDVTEKRHNDALLHSVLDNARDAIISLDAQGNVSLFNRAGEALFGRAARAVLGQNINLLIPATAATAAGRSLSGMDILRHQCALSTEVQGRHQDGHALPLDMAVSYFELDEQRYCICILRDTSERRSLEQQLRQAQKQDAFGQLAGGVAHDFNNLLMVISGYSGLLLSTLDADDESYRFATEIRRAGERAADLTRQLLAFSRQQILEPIVLDLNVIVMDMERMLRRVIGEDVQFSSQLADGMNAVRVDPGQIEQVIMNLAVNARDAMPQGGKLHLETAEVLVDSLYQQMHSQLQTGRYVRLTVSDTGQGMFPEVQARIFEPFFTTKKVGKGTGLGLAVVDGIIRQSGGGIDVYSEAGVGTRFHIYLPAIDQAPVVESIPESPPSISGDATILLVEDDHSVRKLMASSLQAQGYSVLQAENGQAALQLLTGAQLEFDLLLTDLVMPEMSGRQLAEALQARGSTARVLYVSGYTSDAVVRHGVQQAEVNFLHKPFSLNSLAIKVREVLSA